MYLEMSSAKWRPFCLSLYVLTQYYLSKHSGSWQGVFSKQFVEWIAVLLFSCTEFYFRSFTDNTPAFVKAMICRWTGERTSEPMQTNIHDPIKRN